MGPDKSIINLLKNNFTKVIYEKKTEMPKINSGILKISGKLDNKVFSETKHGTVVRKSPKKGVKKMETVMRQQYSMTGFLNRLAGELNSLIKLYGNRLKTDGYY